MRDIRQSPQFARFMETLGWKTETVGKNRVYLKKFPILGFFAKIPRLTLPLEWKKLEQLKEKYRIFKLKLAPHLTINDKKYYKYKKALQDNGFAIEQSPFNPVTTILIDLTQSESKLFNNFSPAKCRAVRRAQKNNIVVKVTDDFESFIKIRKRQYFPMGFLMEKEMHALWKSFYPSHASLLLAYPPTQTEKSSQTHATAYICDAQPVGGILLLFYKKVAYYWLASALKEGKLLFAPTLLVWEALQLAKKRGCNVFDFEGIYDERFPKASESWRGFTKFKEGFGGKKVMFMENFTS